MKQLHYTFSKANPRTSRLCNEIPFFHAIQTPTIAKNTCKVVLPHCKKICCKIKEFCHAARSNFANMEDVA